MGTYLLSLFSREKILPYLAGLRSCTNILPLIWLKCAFIVNSKHYSRSNGSKGNTNQAYFDFMKQLVSIILKHIFDNLIILLKRHRKLFL